MLERRNYTGAMTRGRVVVFAILTALLAFSTGAMARDVTVTVITPNIEGAPIGTGFRWVLQEDVTYEAIPGTSVEDTLATNMYKSYIPVVTNGDSGGSSTAVVTIPHDDRRYYISVLPDQDDPDVCQSTNDCYTMGGKQILPGQVNVRVVVIAQPLATAQISIVAFADIAPINAALDTNVQEPGLGGFDVFVYDFSGGILSVDNYGNPLGTEYALAGDGLTPEVTRLGDGTIHTMTEEEVDDPLRNPYGLLVGEALIKNLAPGKYGVRIVPPQGEGWQQTSTIEGTPGIDAWVKAREPRFWSEFGIAGGGHHVTIGFVRSSAFPPLTGTGTITGMNRNLRISRAPNYDFSNAEPLANCWVALNDVGGLTGLYAAPCNADSSFTIENVPAGVYQVIIFDRYLNLIYNTQSATVVAGEVTDMGDIGTFRWFATLEQWSFYDANEDGMWDRSDPAEVELDEQATILRFRDGSVYDESATDLDGFVPFEEVFPFFNWLVAEIDYARFKPTGVTVTIDNGGQVLNDAEFGEGRRNPQLQNPADGGTNCGLANGTGNVGCLTRTEVGNAALLEGYNVTIGSNSKIEWGKIEWPEGENGGIAGIVYYATTRAEDDPRFAAAEPWEPGIPRVQINLYQSDSAGNIVENNGIPGIQYADVDNHPLGWEDDPAEMGPEDIENSIDGSGAGVFDMGDAIELAHTDSWDESIPTDCPADSNNYDPTDPFNLPPNGDPSTMFNGRCYDGLRNFNQIRPAVFDGGYGLGAPFSGGPYLEPGFYIVEANTPPGYTPLREQDKNVDFGDVFTVNPLALPPVCVGEPNPIPAELVLFPGVEAPWAGTSRPLCNRKLVQVTQGKNMAADFFVHTEVPVVGQWKGFALNDLANEFDNLSPNFGEKFAPSFIPVAVRDHQGNEVYHTTTDAWGTFNVLLPSSFRINTPMASGVSANVAQLCLNSAIMENPNYDPAGPVDPVTNPARIADPDFNKQYGQFCYAFNSQAALTTLLDTPVLPVSAYAGANNWQLDCEFPTLTPVIHSVSVDANGVGGGPYATLTARTISITSVGMVDVLDPNAVRLGGETATMITRDFGFGLTLGTVTINDVELTVTSWSDLAIEATIPAGVTTGQLSVTRGDNGYFTVNAATVIVDDAGSIPVLPVAPGGSIQDALDAAPDGSLVLVSPGNYSEALIITRPVQLQGWGAASTIVSAQLSPIDKIAEWREKVNYLVNCTAEIGLLVDVGGAGAGQLNNRPNAAAQCGFQPGSGLFTKEEAPVVLVAPRNGVFDSTTPARIDGFTLTGAGGSHGVFVNAFADFLEISNNHIVNNHGANGAGGIRVGTFDDFALQTIPNDTDFLNIHHNNISQNGNLLQGGGGIGLYAGSDNYSVTNNYVCGNFAQGDGGGIAHYGLSNNGVIADNKILLNQMFYELPGVATNGGGILIAGQGRRVFLEPHEPEVLGFVVTAGSGNVKILRNHIQGNHAATGDGGGIALTEINGQDILASTNKDTWHKIEIIGNIIVNNVAGMTAGGISLKDAVNVHIVNNTVMNNDSTATAFAAFGTCAPTLPYPNESCPQPAGIVGYAHSADLLATGGDVGTFSDPIMINNIVLGNRSQYWLIGPGPSGFDEGELIIEPGPSDFSVFPPAAGTLTAMSSIVTTGNALGGHVLGTNVEVDGTIPLDCSGPQDCGGIGGTGDFLQTGGLLSVEAEHFSSNVAGASHDPWTVLVPAPNASNLQAIKAAGGVNSEIPAGSSYTTYPVNLQVGDQNVFLRYRAEDTGSNSFHFQIDGGAIQTSHPMNVDNQWHWIELDLPINVATAGPATLTVYRREKRFEADKLVLSTDPAYDPSVVNSGLGPAESAREVVIAPAGNECCIVENPYRNAPPGFITVQPDGTIFTAGEFPAVGSAALDEGGNFIDVHFGPLTPGGDYHLQTDEPNVAEDTGATPSAYPDRSLDIDREPRPMGSKAMLAVFDIGADEITGTKGPGSNQVPQIIVPLDGNMANNISSYTAIPFNLQVIAHDANGDALTYTLCRNTSGTCAPGVGLPVGMSINAVTGLITWPLPDAPDGGGGGIDDWDGFQVSASDGPLVDTHTFRITLRDADAPNAVNDDYDVNNAGQFVLVTPGILDNDTIPDENEFGLALVDIVVLLPTSAGTVSLTPQLITGLAPDLIFTPQPDFIGSAAFTYRVTNNVGSDTATVTFNRNIGTGDSRYEPGDGTYTFTGFGIPGETLDFYLDLDGGGSVLLGSVVVAGDGTYSLNVAGPPPMAGDVIDIQGDGGSTVDNAPLFSITLAGDHPSSSAYVQCPLDTNGNGEMDTGEGIIDPVTGNWVNPPSNVVCRHLGAGDGFSRMGDGRELYGFSFSDLTGVPNNLAIDKGILNAQFPAPTLEFNEGDEVFLTLTNVAMLIRPDLFDPHTVHFHGFPNASALFDGVPESSISINGGFSFTYYYSVAVPGTYMYHCHVEAAEHMQMGMLGNLYVNPAQNGSSIGGYDKFVYNDGDGTTGYDVVVPIQLGSFDATFHDASLLVQPLPFADMHDDYMLMNGRGYPDTILAGDLPVVPGGDKEGAGVTSSNESSQKINSVVTATVGQKILLRISNLNVTNFNTIATTGLPMQVVGTGAHILRGPGGADLYYETNSITIGGGESRDVLIDTTDVTPGTYFLYSTNLNYLSNGTDDFGGMMTEIVITGP